MKDFKNLNDIFEFAMEEEQKAVDFYTALATKAPSEDMKRVFEDFAREEIAHKARLMKVREEGSFLGEGKNIADLQISDYLMAKDPSPGMDYEQALLLAMSREKLAYTLYMDLYARVEEEVLRQLFLSLAREESVHKLRFEQEYDEYFLKEN